ncbi:hypothetical protein BDR03DRAFT_1006476 [Suillus americanus]|nr:hypothetical protein BDR03DRAFT_1006476 [Suillus americanus]
MQLSLVFTILVAFTAISAVAYPTPVSGADELLAEPGELKSDIGSLIRDLNVRFPHPYGGVGVDIGGAAYVHERGKLSYA